jgi:hypothetical protein
MQGKSAEAKRLAAREKARDLDDGDADALERAAASDADNPELDDTFWSRAKPLDAERLERMPKPGKARRRVPKVPQAGE